MDKCERRVSPIRVDDDAGRSGHSRASRSPGTIVLEGVES